MARISSPTGLLLALLLTGGGVGYAGEPRDAQPTDLGPQRSKPGAAHRAPATSRPHGSVQSTWQTGSRRWAEPKQGLQEFEADIGTPDRPGLVLVRPEFRYPSDAIEERLQGTVQLRFLVDERGRIAPKSDPRCVNWVGADRTTRHQRTRFWHRSLCIEAVEGPEMLAWPTVWDAGSSRFRTFQIDGVPSPYFARFAVDYRLD